MIANLTRNETGNQVIAGKLSFKDMMSAYMANSYGYSEPDQILASGDTYNKVKGFLLASYISQQERGANIPPEYKLMFLNATLIIDNTIPEGEVHFAVKDINDPHRVAILKLE